MEKILRILFVGDIHIKFNNLVEVDKVISYIKKNIDSSNIDIAVLAGDILDTHGVVHTQLMNKAFELINTLTSNGVKTYILVGNHDYIDNSQFCSENHWLAGVKGRSCDGDATLTIVDSPIAIENGKIVMVPYVPNGRFQEALDLYLPEGTWRTSWCIFAHQEFKGCKMGAIISEEGDEWDESFSDVISGHIHEKQRPQKNIYYPGSAINHSFGYDSQGISIFTFLEKNKVKEEVISLDFAKKKIEYITVEEATQKFTDEKLKLEKNFKYSLEGTRVEIMEFKKTFIYRTMCKTCKVVFREKKQPEAVQKYGRVVKNFNDILHEKIVNEKKESLLSDYKSIIPQ